MASRPLRGYRRLPGSAHRYRSPAGTNISEYEYRSRKARSAGYRNYAQQRRFRESPAFRSWRFKALSADADAEVGAGSEIERAARRVEYWRGAGGARADQILADPDGPLAELLVSIGARSADWNWPVGDTPAGVRA